MELYHCLNRGVDKRDIFMDDRDRARFVHDMYEFNDGSPARNIGRSAMSDIVSRSLLKHTPIVDIHGWCLMDNHYHLLLSERVDNGVSLFLRKLNVGYARYFNDRHERVGTLFQGRTKRIAITSQPHFLHILHYIHLNPLDFLKGAEHWRQVRVRNARRALQHLESYRWSSYLDYCGTKNFPSVLTTDLFDSVFRTYRDTIERYVNDMEFSSLRPFLLE